VSTDNDRGQSLLDRLPDLAASADALPGIEVLVGRELVTRPPRLRYVAAPRSLPPEVADTVEREWRNHPLSTEPAAASRPLCRYLRYELTPDATVICVGDTTYAEAYGTNVRNPALAERYGMDVLSNALSVSGLLMTREREVVVLRRSGRVHDKKGQWHTVAGHVEPLDGLDPILTLRREMSEELPGAAGHIANEAAVALIRPLDTLKPELCYLLTTDLRRSDAERLQLDFEHDALRVLPLDAAAVSGFLAENRGRIVAGTRALLMVASLTMMPPQTVLSWDW
jgi:8-oxo-dGTP pyrophosphatase MutT (NUDIX family)